MYIYGWLYDEIRGGVSQGWQPVSTAVYNVSYIPNQYCQNTEIIQNRYKPVSSPRGLAPWASATIFVAAHAAAVYNSRLQQQTPAAAVPTAAAHAAAVYNSRLQQQTPAAAVPTAAAHASSSSNGADNSSTRSSSLQLHLQQEHAVQQPTASSSSNRLQWREAGRVFKNTKLAT